MDRQVHLRKTLYTTVTKTVKFDYHRRVQLQLRERLLPLRHEYNYFHYEMYHYRRHVNNYFPRRPVNDYLHNGP